MKSTRIFVGIWLAWAVIVIAFQALATARLAPEYPDRAQDWTTRSTNEGYQQGHVYLLEPFMNDQVAWDSEYYLSMVHRRCLLRWHAGAKIPSSTVHGQS